MIVRTSTVDTGMGVSFIVSTVIHLTVFLLLTWYGSHSPPLKLEETYYVDIVNLPVASPRSGSPVQTGSDAHQAPAPPPVITPPMALPTPSKPGTKSKTVTKAASPNKSRESSPESASEFAERMARLERAAEARQEEAAMARLREKVKSQGSGRAGMPGGTGNETGSDYLAYVQSRLRDAFIKTIQHSSQNPEMSVRIFIDTDGKLSRKKAERSSGDRAFEISVFRAIDAASEKFTPPPGHKVFEGVFVFKREGISQNRP
jgi:colicin import membrane protein